MKTVTLPDGQRIPALGQGTWHMGENKSKHADEVAALRLGIELGMTANRYREGTESRLQGYSTPERQMEPGWLFVCFPND